MEATTIHVVLSDSSGYRSTVFTKQAKVRFRRGLIPFTIDRGETTALWSSPAHGLMEMCHRITRHRFSKLRAEGV